MSAVWEGVPARVRGAGGSKVHRLGRRAVPEQPRAPSLALGCSACSLPCSGDELFSAVISCITCLFLNHFSTVYL